MDVLTMTVPDTGRSGRLFHHCRSLDRPLRQAASTAHPATHLDQIIAIDPNRLLVQVRSTQKAVLTPPSQAFPRPDQIHATKPERLQALSKNRDGGAASDHNKQQTEQEMMIE
jgi:hypothetical protein